MRDHFRNLNGFWMTGKVKKLPPSLNRLLCVQTGISFLSSVCTYTGPLKFPVLVKAVLCSFLLFLLSIYSLKKSIRTRSHCLKIAEEKKNTAIWLYLELFFLLSRCFFSLLFLPLQFFKGRIAISSPNWKKKIENKWHEFSLVF